MTALTSIKGVGDLQAFSVSEECLVFLPAYSHVVLRPRPGYMPKVPTTPFRDEVVNLQALPSEDQLVSQRRATGAEINGTGPDGCLPELDMFPLLQCHVFMVYVLLC